MVLLSPCTSDMLRVRRHVALICLAVLIIALATMLTLPFVGGQHTAAILSAMSVNLGIVLTALAGPLAAWFHAAYKADQRNGQE